MFDALLSHENIKIEDGKLAFKHPKHQTTGDISVFGSMDAVPGNKYHWKVKVFGDVKAIDDINIGIIEADKCELGKGELWWTRYGISYWSKNGMIFKYNEARGICGSHEYGKTFNNEKNVIIDIWLDLKNNNELSFAKNDEKFGTACTVQDSKNYRLAVAIYDAQTKIQLLSYDVEY